MELLGACLFPAVNAFDALLLDDRKALSIQVVVLFHCLFEVLRCRCPLCRSRFGGSFLLRCLAGRFAVRHAFQEFVPLVSGNLFRAFITILLAQRTFVHRRRRLGYDCLGREDEQHGRQGSFRN